MSAKESWGDDWGEDDVVRAEASRGEDRTEGAKHTPGPWRVAPAGDYSSGVNIDAPTGYVALVGGDISDPIEADARLISAAPDLLAALEKAVKHYGKPGGPWNVPSEPGTWIADAHAAIAKAKGEGA